MGPIADTMGVEQGGCASDRLYRLANTEQLTVAQRSELGVHLGQSVSVLVSLLPTLPNLSTLDFSQNLLSLQSVQLLSKLQLPSIFHLSLSGNPLGDLSLSSLTSLLSTG